MPQYVVKVTDQHGWISPPIVANAENEEEAEKAVRLLVGDGENVRVEMKGLRPDVMVAAFGEIPEGVVMYRADWMWGGESNNTPEPY